MFSPYEGLKMAHGITTVEYTGKGRQHTRLHYQSDIGLAAMVTQGLDGGLKITQNLRADQVQALIDNATLVLGQMLEAKAIGTDTLAEINARGIDRLEHLINRAGK